MSQNMLTCLGLQNLHEIGSWAGARLPTRPGAVHAAMHGVRPEPCCVWLRPPSVPLLRAHVQEQQQAPAPAPEPQQAVAEVAPQPAGPTPAGGQVAPAGKDDSPTKVGMHHRGGLKWAWHAILQNAQSHAWTAAWRCGGAGCRSHTATPGLRHPQGPRVKGMHCRAAALPLFPSLLRLV